MSSPLDSLPDTTAVQLRRLIGARDVSPVEVLDAVLARIEQINPAVNAFAATDFERARLAAREAEHQVMRGEPLGLLHGLPIGVKDLQDTAGLLTTYGSPRYRGHVPRADNAMVSQLRRAGAIVIGKTNTPDMGAGANTQNFVWGATGNPFNPELNAGGSSGGSAAALATGMLPLATGSDTGGSLRVPAALCSVVGLRTTPGLVPNDARPLGWSGISVLGPMGRNIDDTALMLAAMVGFDARDPLSVPTDPAAIQPLRSLALSDVRIGFTEDLGGSCVLEPGIARVFRARVAALAGEVAVCEPVSIELDQAHRTFDLVRAEGFLAAFSEVFQRAPDTLSANVRANMDMIGPITLADRAWAHLEQTRIARRFAALFDRFDLVLAPVSPLTPFPWKRLYADRVGEHTMRNYYEWCALTYVVTLSTHPALSLPCGRDEHGMPFGLQVIGRLRGEARLLSASRALEAFFASRPDLAQAKPDLKLLQNACPALRSIVTHPPQYDWPEPSPLPSGAV